MNINDNPRFDRFLKIYFLIVITVYFVFFTKSMLFPVQAAVLTDQKEVELERDKELTAFIPDGYKYYISHYWDAENIYPIIFFKDVPVFDSVPDSDTWGTYHHVYSADGSDPLFYDFFSEADLLNFVENNILPDNVRIRENYSSYARLSVDPITYYTNVDLAYSDTGVMYSRANPYTTTTTELVPGTETTFVGLSSGDLTTGILSEISSVSPVLFATLISLLGLREGLILLGNLLRGA